MTVTDRTERYAARLDAHLATLAPADVGPFLDREFAKWNRAYRQWQRDVEEGTEAPAPCGGPTAHDYLLTIMAIDQRRIAAVAA